MPLTAITLVEEWGEKIEISKEGSFSIWCVAPESNTQVEWDAEDKPRGEERDKSLDELGLILYRWGSSWKFCQRYLSSTDVQDTYLCCCPKFCQCKSLGHWAFQWPFWWQERHSSKCEWVNDLPCVLIRWPVNSV